MRRLLNALLILATITEVSAETGIRFEVRFEGVKDRQLVETMRQVSRTAQMSPRRASTLLMLTSRAEREVPDLLKVLRSQGYYGGKASVKTSQDAARTIVLFSVETGPAYKLKSATVELPEGETPGIVTPPPGELGLPLGSPAKSSEIADADRVLKNWYRERGYPFPKLNERKVYVDHATQSVSVVFHLDPGPAGRFGPSALTGLETVDEGYVRRKVPWVEGQPFRAGLFQKFRERLIETGLFAHVRVTHAESLDAQGLLPIAVRLTERKHRTVRAGASYRTDEGLGVRTSWEHRNLLGGGERLRVGAAVTEIGVSGEGFFRKPEFGREDQALVVKVRAGEDRPGPYVSQSVRSVGLVERELSEMMTIQCGIGYSFADVDQLGNQDTFGLLSVPLSLHWDRVDDLLEPTGGGRLDVGLAPHHDTLGSGLVFLKTTINYSHYVPLIRRSPSLLLAARVRAGSMIGSGRDAVPADERFYAGGGSSIRGYPFMSAGPLVGDTPLGGRSVLETSVELRARAGERLGFVTFLDGGSAFAAAAPDFHEPWLWGAGVGLRYFTSIGPIRLDFAVPLDRRDRIDDAFQVYLSLGQAF